MLAQKLIMGHGQASAAAEFFFSAGNNVNHCSATHVAANTDQTRHAISGTVGSATNSTPVVCIDSAGALLWQRNLTSAASVSASATYVFPNSLRFDSSGNLYVLVSVATSPRKVVVVKYNSSGTLQWQREINGGAQALNNVAMAVNSSGDVYVVTARSSGTYNEGHLLKYNSSGTLQWQIKEAMTGHLYFFSVDLDASGNVYVAGIQGTGSTAYCFVRKYNNAGGALATYMFSSPGTYLHMPLISVDSASNVWLMTRDRISPQRSLLVKLNSSLVVQWAKNIRPNASSNTTTPYSPVGVINDVAWSFHYCSSPNEARIIGLNVSDGSHYGTYKLLATSVESYIYDFELAGSVMVVATGGKLGGTYNHALLGSLDMANMVASYGSNLEIQNATAATISAVTLTAQTATWTQTTGSCTDTAGSLTDAAGSLTTALHEKV